MRIIKYIFCAILFIGVAFAENITINWMDGNTTYAQTTCTIGGDVILPTISKRGYVFRGWSPEYFNRGTFSNWAIVPTDSSMYLPDSHGSTIPVVGDQMILTDASNFPGSRISIFSKEGLTPKGGSGSLHYYLNKTVAAAGQGDKDDLKEQIGCITVSVTPVYGGGNYIFSTGSGTFNRSKAWSDGTSQWILTPVSTYGEVTINFTSINAIKISIQLSDEELDESALDLLDLTVYYIDNSRTYTGTWMLYYHGIWKTDGKAGWQPAYQITNQNE